MIDVNMIRALVLCLTQSHVLTGQTALPADIWPHTAGQATSKLANALTCSGNPAAVPNADGFACGVLAENTFSVRGLSMLRVSAIHMLRRAAVGASLHSFGTTAFRRSSAIVHYGIELGELSVGASFTYARTSMTGSKGSSQAMAAIAAQGKLLPSVTALVHVSGFSAFRSDDVREAMVYVAGIVYETSGNLHLGFECRKIEGRAAETAAAITYQVDEHVRLRAGCLLPTDAYSFGISWLQKRMRIECSFRTHQVLPVTPALLATYQKTDGL